MKKLIVAATLSMASFGALADSCANIINYSISYMVSEGADANVARFRAVYEGTCELAIKARDVTSKSAFKRAIINGSSASFEEAGLIDAADTNTLVASIAYDHAS